MSKGLFFTGTVLKNNRNLLEEEAARQALALQQEELQLRKDQLADQRKKARAEGNKALYKELSIEGAERYSDYFATRQQAIDDFTAENAEIIQDNPNSPEARQLREMQRTFRSDVNLAVNRGGPALEEFGTEYMQEVLGQMSTGWQTGEGIGKYVNADEALKAGIGGGISGFMIPFSGDIITSIGKCSALYKSL